MYATRATCRRSGGGRAAAVHDVSLRDAGAPGSAEPTRVSLVPVMCVNGVGTTYFEYESNGTTFNGISLIFC
jgi:hypothetical protein